MEKFKNVVTMKALVRFICYYFVALQPLIDKTDIVKESKTDIVKVPITVKKTNSRRIVDS